MRLPRPPIPLRVKCLVIFRQLGDVDPERRVAIAMEHRALGLLLKSGLQRLAMRLGCEVIELRLDHDPALGAREKIFDSNGVVVRYIPDANDPEHLFYRTNVSHHIKTNVRGDGAQHPDRVLIKKQRRRERGTKKKAKSRWPSRPLRSASRWPPRGSQKFNRRRKTDGRQDRNPMD